VPGIDKNLAPVLAWLKKFPGTPPDLDSNLVSPALDFSFSHVALLQISKIDFSFSWLVNKYSKTDQKTKNQCPDQTV
jgi:hypothetical protein